MDLGMTGYQVLGMELTPVEVEAAAGVVKTYPIPFFAEIIMFGVYITEDFVAQAADPEVALVNSSKIGGTDVVLNTLVLGNSNVKALKRGDGNFPDAVALAADADLDNGHVVLAKFDKDTNRILLPGDVLSLNKAVAGSGAGGSYVPFVILKISGPDYKSAKVWRETL